MLLLYEDLCVRQIYEAAVGEAHECKQKNSNVAFSCKQFLLSIKTSHYITSHHAVNAMRAPVVSANPDPAAEHTLGAKQRPK